MNDSCFLYFQHHLFVAEADQMRSADGIPFKELFPTQEAKQTEEMCFDTRGRIFIHSM